MSVLQPNSEGQAEPQSQAGPQLLDAIRTLNRARQAEGLVGQWDRSAKSVPNQPLASYGQTLRTNLAIRNFAQVGDGRGVRSAFLSNNGVHSYSGLVLGMRQRMMLWSAEHKTALPEGFADFPPSILVGIFRGMAGSGYFRPAPAREAWSDTARQKSIQSRRRQAALAKSGAMVRPKAGTANLFQQIQERLIR